MGAAGALHDAGEPGRQQRLGRCQHGSDSDASLRLIHRIEAGFRMRSGFWCMLGGSPQRRQVAQNAVGGNTQPAIRPNSASTSDMRATMASLPDVSAGLFLAVITRTLHAARAALHSCRRAECCGGDRNVPRLPWERTCKGCQLEAVSARPAVRGARARDQSQICASIQCIDALSVSVRLESLLSSRAIRIAVPSLS